MQKVLHKFSSSFLRSLRTHSRTFIDFQARLFQMHQQEPDFVPAPDLGVFFCVAGFDAVVVRGV